jgi:hypothetical protein
LSKGAWSSSSNGTAIEAANQLRCSPTDSGSTTCWRRKGTTAAKRRTALAQVEQLELLNRWVKDFDRAVAAVLCRHPDHELFLSFPASPM